MTRPPASCRGRPAGHPAPRPVLLFDTTLRDGEQAPGAALAPHEKLQIALALEKLGIPAIEAGFPASSPSDADAVALVARRTATATVAALARALPEDIRAAAASLAPAIPSGRALLHVFLGTSPLQRRRLRLSRAAVLERIRASVALARSLCPAVLFSAEDATRTELPFLLDAYSAALAAGATAIDLPDTVGCATPDEFSALARAVLARFPGIPLHVHCHDDLGLAAANSLAALSAGASAAHVTLNGIGERAGNCPLEELAVAIALKPSLGLSAPLRLADLYPASRLVSQLTGFPVPRNKAVVGLNAFAHEAGVHQDGLLKNRDTYEFVHPETVGRSGGFELVLGRHSGRAGFIDHLARMGIEVPPDRLAPLYDAFLALADKKKTVYDDDLVELLREHLSVVPRVYALRALQVTTGAPSIPTATVRLEKDGALLQDSATGAGPVEAAFRAIDRITGLAGHLKSFLVQSVTRGQDALGEVSLQVAFDSPEASPVSAKGSDTDIILASAKAYLNALNRHLSRP